MELDEPVRRTRRIEWPTDGQVYMKQDHEGTVWVGPSAALTQEQKKALKQWGKFTIAQRAYGGQGRPPIASVPLVVQNCLSRH